MAGLKIIDDQAIINVCFNDTEGDIEEIACLNIQLPKKPKKKDILFHDLPKKISIGEGMICLKI